MSEANEILGAIREYIGNEQDGYAFYQFCVGRTEDTRGKGMFEALAEDELTHIKKLNAAYDALAAGKGWPTVAELAKTAAGQSVFPGDEDRIARYCTRVSSDVDALDVGIEMEKNSIAAYMAEENRASSAAGKKMFGQLVDEERRHLDTLENTKDYLTSTGSWFQVEEGHMFDGG